MPAPRDTGQSFLRCPQIQRLIQERMPLDALTTTNGFVHVRATGQGHEHAVELAIAAAFEHNDVAGRAQ